MSKLRAQYINDMNETFLIQPSTGDQAGEPTLVVTQPSWSPKDGITIDPKITVVLLDGGTRKWLHAQLDILDEEEVAGGKKSNRL